MDCKYRYENNYADYICTKKDHKILFISGLDTTAECEHCEYYDCSPKTSEEKEAREELEYQIWKLIDGE